MRRLIFLPAVAALAAGCGHSARSTQPAVQSSTSGTTTAAAPPTTTQLGTSQAELLVPIYFLRDGKIAPVGRVVTTPAVATGALRQLASGPTTAERADGLTSVVQDAPSGLAIEKGIATVD